MKPIEKEFSQGVKILLERMENNPEDFIGTSRGYPKFGMFADLMRDILKGNKVRDWDDWYLFTKAEQDALVGGFKKMMRSRFDQGIMQRLLDDPEGVTREPEGWAIDHALKALGDKYEWDIKQGLLTGAPTAKPKQFKLNPSQLEMAKQLGISPIEYGKILVKHGLEK